MDKIFTVENIGKLGMVGLLTIIIATGSMGYWVFGSTYNEMKVEKDRWEAIALDGLKLSRQVSTAHVPIMASSPDQLNKKLTPEEVQDQLNLIKRLNHVD